MIESDYKPDPVMSKLSKLQAQMALLVTGMPGYNEGTMESGVLPPELEAEISHEFQLNATLIDIQMCDLANTFLRDKRRVAAYPKLAACLRAGQRERKQAIRSFLYREGILGPAPQTRALPAQRSKVMAGQCRS